MLLTPWAPHLNLLVVLVYRHQHTRTLSRQERCPKSSEKQPQQSRSRNQQRCSWTLPSDAEQPTKRQRQKKNPREQSQTGPSASSSSCAADTPMHVPEPQVPRDNVQNRQRPAEVKTVLMLARAHSGNEDRSLDEEPKSTAHCESARASQN